MVKSEIEKDTRFAVCGTAVRCGKDVAVTICGGSAHIGAVALAVYEPERDSATVSTITVYTHRDDIIAYTLAKKISKRLHCTVTVTVGLHLDNANAEEIDQLTENSLRCSDVLLQKLQEENTGY